MRHAVEDGRAELGRVGRRAGLDVGSQQRVTDDDRRDDPAAGRRENSDCSTRRR